MECLTKNPNKLIRPLFLRHSSTLFLLEIVCFPTLECMTDGMLIIIISLYDYSLNYILMHIYSYFCKNDDWEVIRE